MQLRQQCETIRYKIIREIECKKESLSEAKVLELYLFDKMLQIIEKLDLRLLDSEVNKSSRR